MAANFTYKVIFGYKILKTDNSLSGKATMQMAQINKPYIKYLGTRKLHCLQLKRTRHFDT